MLILYYLFGNSSLMQQFIVNENYMYIIIYDRLFYLYKKLLLIKKWLYKMWYFSDIVMMKLDCI